MIELSAGGPPLGLLPGPVYVSASLDLSPGDLGVLVTDGVTEALEGASLPLSEAIRKGHVSGTTAEAACEYLLRIAGEAPGPPGAGAWYDDRTAVTFRVTEA